MTREKEPFFTEMKFDSAQYAQDVKEASEKKLERVKKGLIIAAVAQVAWFFGLGIFVKLPMALTDFFGVVAIVGTIAAYIVGGGLGSAFKSTWKFAKKIGIFGWVCIPFPADIFSGLMLTAFAIVSIPLFFIFIPLLLVFLNYIQVKKDYKAAEDFLSYCKVVDNAERQYAACNANDANASMNDNVAN